MFYDLVGENDISYSGTDREGGVQIGNEYTDASALCALRHGRIYFYAPDLSRTDA